MDPQAEISALEAEIEELKEEIKELKRKIQEFEAENRDLRSRLTVIVDPEGKDDIRAHIRENQSKIIANQGTNHGKHEPNHGESENNQRRHHCFG